MVRTWPIFLCLLLFALPAPAQDGAWDEATTVDAVPSVSPPDHAIEIRRIDPERIEELRAAHDYDQDLRRQPTAWEQFKAWVARWFSRMMQPLGEIFINQTVLYLVIIGIVVFAVVMLSRTTFQRIFRGTPRSLGNVVVSAEDIRKMDLDELIAQAEREGDHRRAIRLHYLLVLRGLVDQGILHWNSHYTDQDYMSQIKEPALRSRFSHVALVFQWVWYGSAEVLPARYEELRRPFLEFETTRTA